MLRVAAETELGDLRLDVALEVAAGECLALAGPSGAGKSSVLRDRRRAAAPAGRARGVRRAGVARRSADRPAAGAAPLRLRVPGLRAVPAPERVAERRLRAAAAPRGGSARSSCSSASGSPTAPTPGRARCRAASASAWPSPARSPSSPTCCCSTSRCRRSTPARARRPGASWPRCCTRPACPRCSSRTTSRRRRCSATASG